MVFVLLLATGVYFFIISKIRSENTVILKGNNIKDYKGSVLKIVSLIFESLNKISLSLLAGLMAYIVIKNTVSDFDRVKAWNTEFLLWIALIHFVPATFFCGIVEVVALEYTINKENIEK